jgi:hypothetical protein
MTDKSNPYLVDQLEQRIKDLEAELKKERSHTVDIMIAEIMLALVALFVGYLWGVTIT